MAVYFNGTNIPENGDNFWYNGVNLDKVYYNNVLVWEKQVNLTNVTLGGSSWLKRYGRPLDTDLVEGYYTRHASTPGLRYSPYALKLVDDYTGDWIINADKELKNASFDWSMVQDGYANVVVKFSGTVGIGDYDSDDREEDLYTVPFDITLPSSYYNHGVWMCINNSAYREAWPSSMTGSQYRINLSDSNSAYTSPISGGYIENYFYFSTGVKSYISNAVRAAVINHDDYNKPSSDWFNTNWPAGTDIFAGGGFHARDSNCWVGVQAPKPSFENMQDAIFRLTVTEGSKRFTSDVHVRKGDNDRVSSLNF